MRSFLHRNRWIMVGAAIAVAIVIVLAPLASSNPDGLNRVAADEEFASQEKTPGWEILPGYSLPGVDNEKASVMLAGLAGVTLVFVIPIGLSYVGRRRRGSPRP